MSILKRLGFHDIGRYETRLIALSALISAFSSFPAFQSLVTQYSPPHYCDVTEAVNLTNFSTRKRILLSNWTIPWIKPSSGEMSRSSCNYYNISSLHSNMDIEEIFSNITELELIPCGIFHYEAEETSAVTEFGMVCEKSWQEPLFTSLLMCGMCLGGILAGTLSDKFGRKPVLLGCLLVRYSVTMLTGFSVNLAMYGIMVFLTGMTTLVDYITMFVLVNEVSPSRLRVFVVFVLECSFCLGITSLGLMAYLIPDWRWYLRTTGLFGILFIPYFWLIDESPSWLVATGKFERAEVLLKKIAKINKRSVKSIEEVKASLPEDQKSSTSFKKTLKSFLKEPILYRRLMIMAFTWFVTSMVFYAIIFSNNNLSGNRYQNMIFQGLTGFIAPTLYFPMAHVLGHRKLYMMFTSTVVLVLVAIPFLMSSHLFVVTVIAFVAKVMMGVSFVVIYATCPEIFPTASRQMVFGVCNFSASVGGIIAPFVITVGNTGSNYATAFGTAGAALISIFFFGFLPETKGMKLPQSTQEALKLKSGWTLPFKFNRTKLPKETEDDLNNQKMNVL